MREVHDVVIIGSGPAGLTALTLLLVGVTRALQVLLDTFLPWDTAVYVSYLLMGGILCLAGALFFHSRQSPDS